MEASPGWWKPRAEPRYAIGDLVRVTSYSVKLTRHSDGTLRDGHTSVRLAVNDVGFCIRSPSTEEYGLMFIRGVIVNICGEAEAL